MTKLGELTRLLQEIYPENYLEALQGLKKIIPKTSKRTKPNDWYKHINLYVTYPDSFCEDDNCNFETLTKNIPYIKNLGCNAIHVLPFLKSPMIDAGFDISDYKKVREDLGGNKAFDKFLAETKKQNIAVFIDLVFNHCSFQHEWFQKALMGNEYYRDFFIWSKEKPNFIKNFKDKKGVWGRYLIRNKEIDIYVVFPEQAGDIPHWIRGKDGNWYYHTFYPHQIDINWNNPDVFIEFVKIINYWAKKDVSFRLDAIQFLGRDLPSGKWLDIEKTHKYIQALHEVVNKLNPDTAFLNEVCAEPDVTKEYFGNKETVEAELDYNFPLMKQLWVSVLKKSAASLSAVIKKSYKNIPPWGAWITFLRNHDELSLEAVDEDVRKLIYKELEPKGLPFREGFGLGGRTTSLLGEDIKRIVMSYFLLASLPGSPAIIYGDEIGKLNDRQFMKKQTEYKRKLLKDPKIANDTRDINRGVIIEAEKHTDRGQKIYKQLAKIFTIRLKHSEFFTKPPDRMLTKDNLLELHYRKNKKNFLIYINLSEKRLNKKVTKSYKKVLKINLVKMNDKEIILGAYAGVWLVEPTD